MRVRVERRSPIHRYDGRPRRCRTDSRAHLGLRRVLADDAESPCTSRIPDQIRFVSRGVDECRYPRFRQLRDIARGRRPVTEPEIEDDKVEWKAHVRRVGCELSQEVSDGVRADHQVQVICVREEAP
ncbi:hypothetical protein GOSPT_099_00540 [Gordonia sputi NBRC 100414]|uniref:Uncharacterized protein n=1 Tax=Gordonia sputi NBRC 100414 TaxID=1089453 RepID=H5U3U7_9ACTN|nr:hypothetical protein GOSPT_099_00540 [Gordonia sputi NBRC 100414]